MIVVESIHDAYRLISGLKDKPESLNLGGTKKTDDTENISTAVNVTAQDKVELKKLSTSGVKVYIQQVPTAASKTVDF